jgi:hypothetical protein
LRFSRKVILWSVVLYLALGFPISLLHEMGHAAVCTYNGLSYTVWLDATGGHMVCFGAPRNDLTYQAMGGVFGAIGSAGIVAVWFFAAKRHYAILAVGLAYAVDQVAKIILEGFFTRAYISGSIDAYITALQVASWLGFMLYFAAKAKGQEATTVRPAG